MKNEFLIAGFLLLVVIPTIGLASATNYYFGAFPDETERDATYVYTTVNMTNVQTSVTKDVYGIASAAHQSSGGTLQPYMSQIYVRYESSDDHLYLNSEVWGISSSDTVINPYHCEDDSSCKDMGVSSGIAKVRSLMYWYLGNVKYYAEKYPTSGSVVGYYTSDYDPGADDSGTQFSSGRVTDNSKIVKFTQWGIETEGGTTANWVVELKDMFTYKTSASNFVDDTAKTVERVDGNDSSYITYRSFTGYKTYMAVGDADYCVHRNNNVAGVIEFAHATSSCLGAPVTLWG